jgi:hypothetical protein
MEVALPSEQPQDFPFTIYTPSMQSLCSDSSSKSIMSYLICSVCAWLIPLYCRPDRGGIGQVELLFRCNLMALVGGGPSPHAPPHRVLIWDDHIPKEAGELSFRQVVLSVKLRKDAIAVALRDRIYVYHLADLSLRDKIYTADNPHGLLCLSTQIQDMVLACPSVTTGHVRVELYGLRKTVVCFVEYCFAEAALRLGVWLIGTSYFRHTFLYIIF